LFNNSVPGIRLLEQVDEITVAEFNPLLDYLWPDWMDDIR